MIINFDNAATTFPKPETVRKTAVNAIENLGGNAGRGGHALAMRTSEAVFSARQTIADFFGAEPENVVFTMNCTQAINMAIQGIMSGGGHMIISGMEHNSSARPASELARNKKITLSVAQVYPDDRRTVESFRSLIHKDTKAIVCTLASNVTGQILPYREIAHICKEKNICFIADGAQACGIIDINMNDGINILCTAGHKGLYGITGTGLLISDGKYKIKPIIQGGTGSASSSLYQPDFLPDSLESGTLNVTGAMTIKAGIEFIRKTGIEKIFAHEERICRTFINLLRKNKDIIIYRNPESSYVPIVSFNVKGIMPEKVAEILAGYGYCLRAGYHCSALAHTQLGTENGTIRFAPSVFSRESDAIKLAELVRIVTVSEKSHKTIEII